MTEQVADVYDGVRKQYAPPSPTIGERLSSSVSRRTDP
jgi:hypothetical protein